MTNQNWQEREKLRKQGLLSHQIRAFYRETIGQLKRTTSLSKKGKPRKQAWGMHIVNPMRYRKKYVKKVNKNNNH